MTMDKDEAKKIVITRKTMRYGDYVYSNDEYDKAKSILGKRGMDKVEKEIHQ